MTVSATLLVCAVVLTFVGSVLVLTRSLTRVLMGIIICGNGVNLFVLAGSGPAGVPPLLYPGVPPETMSDPFPQAIVLTAVVITLGTTAFVLAMAYRSTQLTGSDFVPDDLSDRRVALRAELATERSQLRAKARAGETDRRSVRRSVRELWREQRRRLRDDRAYQARAGDYADDRWDDVLGADPESPPTPQDPPAPHQESR
ncbi:Na(+)/H(+) antiporter subunit C [Streptomyces sp. NBC_00237]|uniref:Na(+)/H(+) antiporter subunit C n=1 Tax=Streptomyces sp. NBC_00237 TaxID=2975687 RepID=UPI0022524143|nr:Na(+)/H(+) antiporter subunit C [Streptomyces sp. NBC_00237]MCX5200223.1 Na(+)/H(+) antiporter subunit C [Streptomyces sp. NBC_00237]